MIAEKWPTLAKFLKNIVGRIDIIGVPIEKATVNYINNVNPLEPQEKEMLIRDTEEFLETVEENLEEFNELAWRAHSSDQARSYMADLLEIMKTTAPW